MKMWTDILGNGAPKKSEIDFSYLQKYGSRDKYQILTCFDKCNFKQGQSFEARVTQIYDPTKFWIVSKFRELEVFQKYLFRFYYLNSSNYKIPHDKIAIDLYCMCFIENAYYRGVIVGFPIRHHDAEQEVQVFLIDYGMLKIIDINNIYYISEECLRVPQFVVRASLAGIRPLNDHWTTQDVDRFYDLVTDKIIKVNVIDIDCKRKILKVFINIKDDNSMISVQETLLTENYAAYIRDKEKTVKTIQTLGFKSPYLFPSHKVLESGKVPFSVRDAEYQEQIAPLTYILRNKRLK